MAKNLTSKINLQQLSECRKHLTLHLDDTFFTSLDQHEIIGGEVDATLDFSTGRNDLFLIKISISGSVVVNCDRCLAPLDLKVDFSEEVMLTDDPNEDNLDVVIIDQSIYSYDISWFIYETIIIHLPIERIHINGSCTNKEILNFISNNNN